MKWACSHCGMTVPLGFSAFTPAEFASVCRLFDHELAKTLGKEDLTEIELGDPGA